MSTLEILVFGAVVFLFCLGALKGKPWISGGRQTKTESTKDKILTWVATTILIGFCIWYCLIRSGLWERLITK